MFSIGFAAFSGAFASPLAQLPEDSPLAQPSHATLAQPSDAQLAIVADEVSDEGSEMASALSDVASAASLAVAGPASEVALHPTNTLTEANTQTAQNAVAGKAAAADTVPEFYRDIESVVFVPKGQWVTGISVSYATSSQSKYQFLIFEGISGDTYSFKISPMLMHVVIPDLGVGGRFAYARSLTKVENADIVLDSETDYQVDHLYRLSHNYYFTAMTRNYFSIGKSKRFGFFNELQLQMGGGQTKLTTGVGTDLTGMYERNFSLDIGLMPGICLFLNNYSALEVNIGVLGFSYTATKAIRDQIYVSRRNSKSANFRINLFSIQFGVSFYL